MKHLLVFVCTVTAGVTLLGDSACTGSFPTNPSGERLEVSILPGGPTSSLTSRLPISFTNPDSYSVKVRALRADGTLDTSFNGYVRFSSKPGSVQAVSGPNTNGRNVQLQNGEASNVTVSVLAAYGNTYITAEDVGYVPADPARVCTSAASCPARCKVGQACPPACANGVDDNDNGLIDYPTEPGCFLANDDTEDGGTYTSGISPPLYYYIPRIADVRGGPEGGTGTPFPSQAVNIDCGFRGANSYAFSVVVTRVSSNGFYVSDVAEDAPGGGGFGGIFAFNFNAPPNMRQCDRLRAFGGTTSDFYGFTEVNYPTWEVEEWDPAARPCLIPTPHTLAPTCTLPTGAAIPNCVVVPPAGSNTTQMLSVAASLVRVASTPGAPTPVSFVPDPSNPGGPAIPSAPAPAASAAGAGTIFHISTRFGKAHPAPPTYAPTADATNCDLNNSGKVDRTDPNELACANACAADAECSEYANFLSQNQFNLIVQTVKWSAGDTAPTVTSTVDVQGDGSTDPTFNPALNKGLSLGSFTGTLDYFSGGSQYTIQARCQDDIVPLGQPPVPSDTACVHARTILDTGSGSN
jgi:hypothetical protein